MPPRDLAAWRALHAGMVFQSFNMFDLPPWVATAAAAFGILVSVRAGLYPAGRAARVEPVEALRHD